MADNDERPRTYQTPANLPVVPLEDAGDGPAAVFPRPDGPALTVHGRIGRPSDAIPMDVIEIRVVRDG